MMSSYEGRVMREALGSLNRYKSLGFRLEGLGFRGIYRLSLKTCAPQPLLMLSEDGTPAVAHG